jgi:YVTN family beta-propeller protein
MTFGRPGDPCPKLTLVIRLPPAALSLPLLLAAGCGRTPFPTYPDGYRQFAYVANSAGNTVTILDIVYLRDDRTLSVGVDPVAIAANPKRDEVYVVNAQPDSAAGSISVIDTQKNAVVATIPVRRNPTAIAVDETGQRAYVINTGSNSVTVIDLDKRSTIATGATGEKPASIVIAPDGRSVVVANRGSGSVSIYSAFIPSATVKSGAPLTLRSTFNGCAGASDAVILPDSTKAFVACSAAHQVMSVYLAAAPDSWPAKQDSSLTSDHLLTLLDVGRNPTNLTLKPDGGEIFVSNRDSDSISEINTQTNEVGSTYPIGHRPAHGVVSVDNGALWVSNLGAQAVSLYSVADGKFVRSIGSGPAPDALAFSDDPDQAQNFLLAADTKSGDVAIIRTTTKLGPALQTILPAGGSPAAIAVKAMPAKP